MNTIGKDEFYHNVSDFMRSKGIELTEGGYAEHIRRGCGLLTDFINATQRTVSRAREEVDKKLLQLRQCIHDATAPPKTGSAPAPDAPEPKAPAAADEPSSPATPETPPVTTASRKPRKKAGARQAAARGRTRRSKSKPAT